MWALEVDIPTSAYERTRRHCTSKIVRQVLEAVLPGLTQPQILPGRHQATQEDNTVMNSLLVLRG